MKHKREEAPEWVFPWQGLRASSLPKILATLLVLGAFGVFLTSVRIRLAAPVAWAAPKAAVIRVLDDAEGRSLTMRAREGGPFPSRYEPAEWQLAPVIEQVAWQAARWRPPPYRIQLRELPDEAALPQLAKPGSPVLPSRQPTAEPTTLTGTSVLVPALYPLSGITPAEMPRKLPPFQGAVSPAWAAGPWRFLLRLEASGRVVDCVSLTGGDQPGKAEIEGWLRQVSFQPGPAGKTRWIALDLGFSNQPANGTDAR